MTMSAKVENYCIKKDVRARNITVDRGVRACINCIWYELYYRENRGNVSLWTPTCTGYCLRKERERGALRQPCKSFERKEGPQ